MENTFFSDITIEIDRAKRCVESVTASQLEPVAIDFLKNIENTDHLLQIPYLLVLVGNLKAYSLGLSATVMQETGAFMEWETSKSAREAVDKEVKKRLSETDDYRKASKQELARLLQHPEIRAALRALVLLSLASAWTAFECLAKDTWILSLNNHPLKLGQHAIQGITDMTDSIGLNQKSISVGILAKYGFDLRTSLGSVLAQKFDFTGVSGIRAAYYAAFGRSSQLEGVFADRMLTNLEATRHMIIHKAAMIDEEFKTRTGNSMNVGEAFETDSSHFSSLFNSAITSGCSLLEFVNSWLATNLS